MIAKKKSFTLQGAKNNDILKMNSSLIIRIIKERGICSRVELAKATGLTQAGITKLIASLIELDIIRETGILSSNERGRKSIGLCLNGDFGKVISIKFTKTVFILGVYDISGKLYTQSSVKIDEYGSLESAFSVAISLIGEFLIAFCDIQAIGLALPGPYLKQEKIIAMPDTRHDWYHFQPQSILEAYCDLPVFALQDTNAAALASWWSNDRSSKTRSLAYMLLGERIGTGIVIDGQLFEGSCGTAAEIGHISIDINGAQCVCGNKGCLELYCSSDSLVKKAVKERGKHPESGLNQYRQLTYFDIFNEYDKQDALATQLLTETYRYIGYGVITIIHAYNPDTIILGDQLARGGDLLLSTIRKTVAEHMLPDIASRVIFRIASGTQDSVLYGAAITAIDHILEKALDFEK